MADSLSATGSSSSNSFLVNDGTTRMFGLASGMDIDSMVNQLMEAEQVPLQKLEQQKQLLEWKQDDYRDMNSQLLDLRTTTFNMSLEKTYLSRTANSSEESLVTATASSNSSKTSYILSSGTTAKASYVAGESIVPPSSTKKPDPTKSLWENRDLISGFPSYTQKTTQQATQKQLTTSGTTFNIGNKYILDDSLPDTITVEGTTDTPYTVFTDKKQYDADTSKNKVYINTTSGDMTFSNNIAANSNINIPVYSYGEFTNDTFTDTMSTADETTGKMVDTNFTFKVSQSINDIVSSINNSDTDVTAFYSTSSGQFSITRNSTGKFNTEDTGKDISFATDGFFSNTLGLTDAKVTDGEDAELVINGVTATSHTNTMTVNNVTFNVKGDFQDSTVTVNVDDDTEDIYDQIISWIDKYNSTIATINDKVDEKRDRDYAPLTDSQEADMTDNQIELWNKKAKSGMIANDPIFTNGLTKLRTDIYTKVSGVDSDYDQLSELGITTSSDYSDNGKLEVDEAKLKAAIAANPEAVMNLFTQSSSDYKNQGIMKRLTDSLDKTMSDVTQKAGKSTSTYNQFFIGKSIHDIEDQIDSMQDHLADVQQRYYTQFTAMEQAVEQANQQSSYITNNLG